MCVITLIQVIGRYILTDPPAWTEELATILFTWLVFVGASLALKRNEHFVVAVFVDWLPDRLGSAARGIAHTLVAICCLVLIWYGVGLTISGHDVDTAVLELPRSWVYLAIPVGALLMLLRTISLIWRRPQAVTRETES
ncbi:Sialic acid TRAP transporter permease protein SiaT [Mucisphaera calidilacus]|uniref:Sialic acid TRAP transporter permease protein SiaT n=2 Tax=Mucisphaera calidilacus TaxID=2527982 RepID=A0A518BWU3_9BACT|nr:Sialic acid TRAP transporter permease protein SiaT [Mucisphaera calidilacus]